MKSIINQKVFNASVNFLIYFSCGNAFKQALLNALPLLRLFPRCLFTIKTQKLSSITNKPYNNNNYFHIINTEHDNNKNCIQAST